MPEPGRGRVSSNLAQRVATAVVGVPLLLCLLFVAPQWGFVVFLGLFTVVAASELFAMTLPGHPVLRAWGCTATLGFFAIVVYAVSSRALPYALFALVLSGALAAMLSPRPIEGAALRMGWLIAGPLYVGGLLGAIGLLFLREHGGAWVVLAMLLAWFADTGAYFAGRGFGKHKLFPVVSPKKTLEGSVGGLLGSLAGGLLAHYWFLPALPLSGAIALGLGAGAIGQGGDLCISLIKRSSGVKDTGKLLPGHGGLLDRIDALLFTGTLTWIYADWLAHA